MKRILITTALVAFSTAPGFAQSDGSTTTGSRMQDQMMPGSAFQASELMDMRIYMPRESAGDGMQDNQTDTMDQTDGAVAGNDTGMQRNPEDWEMVGEIDDVIMNANGEVVGLVVDSGGFLGMGANQQRIAIEDVRFMGSGAGQQNFGDGTQQTAADETEQDMGTQTHDTADAADQQNPEMRPDGQSNDFTVVYTGDRRAFEDSEPYDETRAAEAGETRGSQSWGDRDASQYDQVNFSDLTTEELLGAAVYGSNDDWIGEVSELSVGNNGDVEDAIIDVGGFLGIGEKPVSLPMDELDLRRTDGDELRVYVNYTEDQLDSMETWESDSDL